MIDDLDFHGVFSDNERQRLVDRGQELIGHSTGDLGCSRYTGKVTDDKYRPVEVTANAKGPILAILGHSDSFVGVRK